MRPTFQKIKQGGQGMTEYIVIVAMIAVAGIACFQFFGQTIRTQTGGIAQEVAGKSADPSIKEAQGHADNVQKEGNTKKGLDNYSNDNSRGTK